MTGSRHEQQASTHTATGIAPDSHRIPSSQPLPAIQPADIETQCSVFNCIAVLLVLSRVFLDGVSFSCFQLPAGPASYLTSTNLQLAL